MLGAWRLCDCNIYALRECMRQTDEMTMRCIVCTLGSLHQHYSTTTTTTTTQCAQNCPLALRWCSIWNERKCKAAKKEVCKAIQLATGPGSGSTFEILINWLMIARSELDVNSMENECWKINNHPMRDTHPQLLEHISITHRFIFTHQCINRMNRKTKNVQAENRWKNEKKTKRMGNATTWNDA